jgi:hypothetical protein
VVSFVALAEQWRSTRWRLLGFNAAAICTDSPPFALLYLRALLCLPPDRAAAVLQYCKLSLRILLLPSSLAAVLSPLLSTPHRRHLAACSARRLSYSPQPPFICARTSPHPAHSLRAPSARAHARTRAIRPWSVAAGAAALSARQLASDSDRASAPPLPSGRAEPDERVLDAATPTAALVLGAWGVAAALGSSLAADYGVVRDRAATAAAAAVVRPLAFTAPGGPLLPCAAIGVNYLSGGLRGARACVRVSLCARFVPPLLPDCECVLATWVGVHGNLATSAPRPGSPRAASAPGPGSRRRPLRVRCSAHHGSARNGCTTTTAGVS